MLRLDIYFPFRINPKIDIIPPIIIKKIMTKNFTKTRLARGIIPFLLCLLVMAALTSQSHAQTTEGFEDEKLAVAAAGSGNLRTFSEGGINFVTNGRMVIFGNEGSSFGANSSNYYMHSRPTISPATGNIGGFSITTAATSFRIINFAAYMASDLGGVTSADGNVTFTGTLASGGTVSETISINSTSGSAGYDLSNAFTGALNAQITSLSITLPAGIQYLDLDEIQFVTAPIVASQYSINDVSQNEGNSGTSQFLFTISRTQTTTSGSVNYATSDNTAITPSDYVSASGTANFAVGESTKQISVTVNGEVLLEPDETFFVNLSTPVNGVLLKGQGIGTIRDDDSVTENFEGETHNNQTFSQNGFSFASTGSLLISNNGGSSSSSGLDTRTNNGGSTGTVGTFGITTAATSFNIVSIEAFTSSNDGGSATGGNVTFTGTKADGSGTVNHTATITASGLNYTLVNFAGTPLANTQLTSISITLSSGLNYVAFDNFKFGTGTILVQQVSINDVTMVEGTGAGNTNMTFTLTRTATTPGFSVDVNLTHVTSDNSDLVTPFNTTAVTFPNGGALTQTVTVPISRDAIAEPNEIFQMILSNATNGASILDGLGIGTINDDDGIIETFEDDVNNAKAFSQNGIQFTATGDFRVQNASNFGSGPSNFFLNTGINNGGTPAGSAGSLNITTANKGFKLVALDAWTSSGDGNAGSQSAAVIRFRGTLVGGGTVQADKNIAPTGDIPAGWVKNIGFGGTPLDNVALTSLEVIIISGANFVALDNFSYVTVNTDPEIEITDANMLVILSGGSNSPSSGNSTDFGAVCLENATVSRTFTIRNLANLGSLSLTGSPVVLSGTGASHFSVTTQAASSVSALGLTTFTIQFDPSASGTHNATVEIANSDLDENPYTFYIRGVGNAHPTVSITAETQVCQTETVNLVATSAGIGATYQWTGNGVNAINSNETTVYVTVPGTLYYNVTVTNANNCATLASKYVEVNAVTVPTSYAASYQNVNNGSLFSNSCEFLAKIMPSGNTPVSGMVSVRQWVESDPSLTYVRRHYEITPDYLPETSTGIITLYFSQADFDAYNATIADAFLPETPSSPVNNVQILKFSGISEPGDGMPAHYNSSPSLITPSSVEWNSILNLWEVTFTVSDGFSGFFLKSTEQPLPVKLVSFFGKKIGDNQNKLTWVTSEETNFKDFEITRSADAIHFETIGRIEPVKIASALRSYEFVDNHANGMIYYRLKMVDKDGTFEFSKIISLDQDQVVSAVGSIYPNPAVPGTTAKIDIFAQKAGNWTLTTFNLEGKVIQAKQLQLKSGMNTLTIDALTSGMNLIHISDGGKMVVVRKIVKP
jgi:hypothetical protein